MKLPTISIRLALVLAGIALAAPAGRAQQNRFWSGAGGNTNWSNPGNWITGVPVSGDTAFIIGTAPNIPNTYDLSVTLQSLTFAPRGPGNGNYVMSLVGPGPLGLQSGGFITFNNNAGGFDALMTGLTLNGPATITEAGTDALVFNTRPIIGTGPLTLVNNSGIDDNLQLQVANSYTGATIIGAGNRVQANVDGAIPNASALTVTTGGSIRFLATSTIGSLAGGGNVFIVGTLSAGGDNTSTTYSGVLADGPGGTGAASLTKVGSGTMTLAGANTYTGTTTINAGTLLVNGSIVSATTVNPGGTLGGTGIVGPTIVNGTIAPGLPGGIGTLTVNGAYIQNAGSTYQVLVNGAGQSSRVEVNGAATINGGTVVVGSAGGFVTGTPYTILTATGGRTGVYSGLIDNIPLTVALLSYDSNDVFLTLVTNASFLSGLGQTLNQRSVAGAVGGLPLSQQLVALPAGRVPFALDQLSGEIHASNVTAGLENHSLFLRTLAERLRQSRCLCGTDAAAPGCEPDDGWHAWATPFGQAGKAVDNGNAHGFAFDSVGFAAGADRWLSGDTLIGFAAGYDNWQNNTDLLGSRSDVNSFLLGLYAYQQFGRGWLLGTVSYENDSYNTTRPIDFLAATAQGNYGGSQVGSYLEAGYGMDVGGLQVQPIGAVQYISMWRNSFSETGAGAADLNVASARADSFRSYLGGRLTMPLGRELCWLPEVRAFWVHEYAADTRDISNQFAAGGRDFLIYGQNLGRDWGQFSAGLSTQLRDRVRMGLHYDAFVTPNSVAHGGMVQVQMSW